LPNFATAISLQSRSSTVTKTKNEKVLASYPQVEGIPHFFVLKQDGTLLYSQGIVKLETGGEPDPEKIKDFFLRWSIHTTKDVARAR